MYVVHLCINRRENKVVIDQGDCSSQILLYYNTPYLKGPLSVQFFHKSLFNKI